MKYMGSKSRIKKYIIPIIQSYIDKYNKKFYIEPFVGGANVIDGIQCENRIGTDANRYLIALLNYVSNGLSLPEEITREEYSKVRSNPERYDDWYVGCVGFLASYNGRFFDGGYAQAGYEGKRYRDYYKESKSNILNQAPQLKDIMFEWILYDGICPENSVIYCDPPYQNTKQYGISKSFDYDMFWDKMRDWSLKGDNIVLISEQQAPDDFECIWQQEVSRSIKATDKSRSIEKLFRYKGENEI